MVESVRLAALRRVLTAFERLGVRYVLVGSMAMAAHGVAWATEDIDFFVSPEEENVRRLRQALYETYHDESVFEISSEDLAGAYPVVRYGPPDPETLTIDLIGRLGDAYSFDDIEAEPVKIGGSRGPRRDAANAVRYEALSRRTARTPKSCARRSGWRTDHAGHEVPQHRRGSSPSAPVDTG